MKILNKDLMTPDQIKNARLQATIDAFKKYDKERKEYIKQLEHDLQDWKYRAEDAEAHCTELLEEIDIGKVVQNYKNEVDTLKAKVKNLKNTCGKLETKLHLCYYYNEVVKLSDDEILKFAEIENVKNQNSLLRKQLKKVRSALKTVLNKCAIDGAFNEAQGAKIIDLLEELNSFLDI